jgi:hypothetical protein
VTWFTVTYCKSCEGRKRVVFEIVPILIAGLVDGMDHAKRDILACATPTVTTLGQLGDETQRTHRYRRQHRRPSSLSARYSFRDSHRSLTRLPQSGACRGTAVSVTALLSADHRFTHSETFSTPTENDMTEIPLVDAERGTT